MNIHDSLMAKAEESHNGCDEDSCDCITVSHRDCGHKSSDCFGCELEALAKQVCAEARQVVYTASVDPKWSWAGFDRPYQRRVSAGLVERDIIGGGE